MDWLLPALIVAAVCAGGLLVMLRTRDAIGGGFGLGGAHVDPGGADGGWDGGGGDGGGGGGD